MTFEETMAMLQEADLPLAYDHFAEGESPDPPFLVFLFPESENVFADDTVYQKVEDLNVELYTDSEDPKLEKKLETILTEQQCPYVKTEVWIPDERMYEVLYQTQIIKED